MSLLWDTDELYLPTNSAMVCPASAVGDLCYEENQSPVRIDLPSPSVFFGSVSLLWVPFFPKDLAKGAQSALRLGRWGGGMASGRVRVVVGQRPKRRKDRQASIQQGSCPGVAAAASGAAGERITAPDRNPA